MTPTHAAAVFRGNGRIEIERRPRPQPGPHEVLLRLEGCGVCGSNLPVWAGKPWFRYPLDAGAPGHEGWGEIVALGGEVDGFRVGDRVAALSQRAYAEYDVAPATMLAKLPPRFGERPLPGEPLACVMNIFRRSDIRAGQNVAVIGVGFLGALLIQLAANAGARVFALSRREYALDIARRCGAHATFACGDAPAALAALREASDAGGCERVIEAAGEQASLDLATGAVAEGGRLIVAGYHQDGPRTIDMQLWNWRGIDVINAHERDPAVVARGLRDAMAALEAGVLDPLPLLTHQVRLDRINDAFEALRDRPDGFLKATVAL